MKKAMSVRMPWPKSQRPTTEQLESYISIWHRDFKPLMPDPGAGDPDGQTSFWLDTQVLDASAEIAGCIRAGRPDRAAFIRRIIATYHVRSVPTAKSPPAIRAPRSVLASPHPHQATRPVEASGLSPASETVLPKPTPAPPKASLPKPIPALSKPRPVSSAPTPQVKPAVPSAPPKALAPRRQTLHPSQVNDISRKQGLGMSWQPGNLYRIGRNAFGKHCLIQSDENGVQLARYGSW
jgi:hypothetical protein